MTETFLFVRLGEGEVYRNVVWKLQKCHDRVGGDDDDHRHCDEDNNGLAV